jgi:hypothetical protein
MSQRSTRKMIIPRQLNDVSVNIVSERPNDISPAYVIEVSDCGRRVDSSEKLVLWLDPTPLPPVLAQKSVAKKINATWNTSNASLNRS